MPTYSTFFPLRSNVRNFTHRNIIETQCFHRKVVYTVRAIPKSLKFVEVCEMETFSEGNLATSYTSRVESTPIRFAINLH